MKNICLRLALLLPPVIASAQSNGAFLNASTLDYLFDQGSSRVRPVWGIPGAAYVGDALPVDLSGARVSTNRRFALGADPASGQMMLMRLGDEVTTAAISGMSQMAGMAFSPNGGTAALYDPDGGHVEVWTGLPDQPSAGGMFEAGPSLRSGPLSGHGGGAPRPFVVWPTLFL